MTSFRTEADVLEGTDFTLVGAITMAVAGQPTPVFIVQSDVTGQITLAIYEAGNATPIYGPASLMLSTVIFNTPQLDGFWEDEDSIGYNFRTPIRQVDVGAGVLKGGRRYTIIVSIPTATAGILHPLFVPNIIPLQI